MLASKTRKLLALLLSLTMCVSLLGTAVYAAEEGNNSSLPDASVCTCESTDGTHAEGCPLYVPAEDPGPSDGDNAVDTVISMIDALPEEITLEDEPAVQAARDAYDALTAEQQALVTNYAVLTSAEAALAELKEPTDPAPVYVAEVDGVSYESLDAAIEAAEDGAIIQLLSSCSAGPQGINKSITIQGPANTTDIVVDFSNCNGINITGCTLTFKDCTVQMTGIQSGYTIQVSNGGLTLDHALVSMKSPVYSNPDNNFPQGIYGINQSIINILNGSKLTIEGYSSNAISWDNNTDDYGINIIDSKFVSNGNRSGFTGTHHIKIENSTVDVINSSGNGSNGSFFTIINSQVTFNNNGSHGLSAAILEIDHSIVTASGNGANGIHTNNDLFIKNGSVVTVENNACSISSEWTIPGAIHVQDQSGTSSIDSTSTVTIRNNKGSGLLLKSGTFTIENGATVSITNNEAQKLEYGGGINNRGTLVLSPTVSLYNNHAAIAGDDIYNGESASVKFSPVGSNWVLDDCNHTITGWFYDGYQPQDGSDPVTTRWNGETSGNGACVPGRDAYYQEYTVSESEMVTGILALKAAHGYVDNTSTPIIPPTTDPTPEPTPDPTPDPDPDPSEPTEEIPDEDVPQGELPEQPEQPGDPGTQPENPEETVIDEEEPPMADAPETGDNLALWVTAASLSGLGLIALVVTGRKRKEQEK